MENYKKELESAIYEGADEKMYIGGRIVENVLNDFLRRELRKFIVWYEFPSISANSIEVEEIKKKFLKHDKNHI